MKKLKLKASQKTAVEIGLGSNRFKFEPGQIVEVEREEIADYLLGFEQIMQVKETDGEQKADEQKVEKTDKAETKGEK